MTLGAAFVRVSTGSQDEISQIAQIKAEVQERGITIVKWFRLHGYSASGGMQEPALREVIADMERGEYTILVVTESGRLDRREDLDAQAEILLSIRSAGGDVLSLTEPQFGRTDFAGRIVTMVTQYANAEKSKTVKDTVYRGVRLIIANKAIYGKLPSFWETHGERYAKQAFCADPAAVNDIFERIANGESQRSVGRHYGLLPLAIYRLIRFGANHTGVVECRYTHGGETETWTHEVVPVVDSSLWWRANKMLDANTNGEGPNKGGRPVASPLWWISGSLDCPECDGKLYVQTGQTRAGNPRTVTLRCGGRAGERLACGRFKGCAAQPIIDLINGIFANDHTEILAFQRIAGNSHELDALNAELRKIQALLSATEDDDELDALIARRKEVKTRIEGYVIVPDSYDYAPTGRTVASMWSDGDIAAKTGMVRAVKKAWGLTLASHDGQWAIDIGAAGSKGTEEVREVVDLGNGLCFRR